MRCCVRGHDLVMHFEPHRIALQCVLCGYCTPGWTIGEHPPEGIVLRLPSREPVKSHDRAA